MMLVGIIMSTSGDVQYIRRIPCVHQGDIMSKDCTISFERAEASP